MKRFGIVQGAIACSCAWGALCCGGRTSGDWDWDDKTSGGASTGGRATGGTSVLPASGGKPAVASGGRGAGGQVSPTSGGALGSGGAAPACAAGMVSCGSKCVNLQSDPNHCGSCALACGDSGCVAGLCVASCPAPLLACGTQCIDPGSNLRFCGASGTCSGMQRGQPCGDLEECRLGRCTPVRRSCLNVSHAGEPPSADGYYEIAPGSDPTQVEKVFCEMEREGGGWTRCFELQNTVNEDLDGNDWFDRCVDWTMATWSHGEFMLEVKDASGVLIYIARGKRESAWTYDALTSNAGPNEQAWLPRHNPIPLSNSDWLRITGRSGSNQGCEGAQGNGYGILISPGSMVPMQDSLRLMVMPYRMQVGSHAPRQFGFNNLQWFPSDEISFAATAPFDTCGVPPPLLGSFEFYVR